MCGSVSGSSVGSGGSGTHCSTSHLNCAYNDFLRSDKFETFEVKITYLYALAQRKRRNVNGEMLGDVAVKGADFELTHHGDEATAGTDTLSETLRSNGHTHNDRLLSVNFIEVYVKDVILYRMELHLLEDTFVVFAIDINVDEVDVRGVDDAVNLLLVYNEVDCLGIALLVPLLSVKYARNFAFATELASCFLTEIGTCTTTNRNLFHNSGCVTLN